MPSRSDAPTAMTAIRGGYSFFSVVSMALILAGWWLATRNEPAVNAHLPSPYMVWSSIEHLARDGYLGAGLWESIGISAGRVFVGWGLSVTLGVAIGFAMGLNSSIREIINPWLQFYRPLPPLGYLGLIVLWLGVGELSKTVLLVLAGLPPVIIGTAVAVASVRRERIEGAQSLGIHGTALIRFVIAPSALPAILLSARIAFGAVFAALIGAEMIASSSGIAWMIISATNRGATSVVIAAVLTMGVLAVIADRLLRLVEKLFVPWVGRA